MNLYSTLYFHISDIEFESFFLGFILNDFMSNLMLHQTIMKELQKSLYHMPGNQIFIRQSNHSAIC